MPRDILRTGRPFGLAEDPRLTIMIPTMGRPGFVLRLLDYYSGVRFRHRVVIGDSSEADVVAAMRADIERFEGRLDVVYQECPGLNDRDCLRELVLALDTPYAVFVADDDFLVPAGLEESMTFLDLEPGYSSAHGVGATVVLDDSGPRGRVVTAGPYAALKPVEGATAAARLRGYLSDYSVMLFSVQRAAVWRAMYPDVSLPDKSFESELLPCCLSVVEGPSRQLEKLQVVRQVHDRQYSLPGPIDWMMREGWRPAYLGFREVIAGRVAEKDGISVAEGLAVVEEAFLAYLTNVLRSKLSAMRAAETRRASRRGLLASAARWVKYRVLDRDAISLTNLLAPGSRYYDDFMPVYRALTGAANDR